MADIVLTTINAKYIHASFGLRYLIANLGDLQPRARLVEFDLSQRPQDIAECLLELQPRIIGFGVYIWNVAPVTAVVKVLKRIRPELTVIVGGPEVSFEHEHQELVALADHVITGEADVKFREVCCDLLNHKRPAAKVLASGLPDPGSLNFPYDFYSSEDIAHRVVYVEASRGCPFSCEFCLSSLEVPVRQFAVDAFLDQMDSLLNRGVREFKFVDRTFNLNLGVSRRILEFFLQRLRPGLFAHFEMIPDRLPEPLRELIVQFPAGTLQFELGIQSFNPEVCDRIHRRQDFARLEDNLRFLREQTAVYLHADLIAGLPGESLESFGAGFDRLVGLRPQEIQIGLLKRLRGTPIVRHDAEWGMIYNPEPPYEILQNRTIDFSTMQRLRRLARFWDLVSNSGRFTETAPLIWRSTASPFKSFLRWSDWLHSRTGRSHGIALDRLAQLLFEFLTGESGLPPADVALQLGRDYERGGRSDVPPFLRQYLPPCRHPLPGRTTTTRLKRQARRMPDDRAPESSLAG